MPYHKKMVSMLDKMEKKYPSINFFAIDVDFFKSFTKRFCLDSIPTILIFKNSKEVKRINGLILTSALSAAFADICKTNTTNVV
jgi:thioredoxin-like negative regulator of GroEL